MDRLKEGLEALGLKCGGTLEQRADRLFSVKGKKPEEIDQKLKVCLVSTRVCPFGILSALQCQGAPLPLPSFFFCPRKTREKRRSRPAKTSRFPFADTIGFVCFLSRTRTRGMRRKPQKNCEMGTEYANSAKYRNMHKNETGQRILAEVAPAENARARVGTRMV